MFFFPRLTVDLSVSVQLKISCEKLKAAEGGWGLGHELLQAHGATSSKIKPKKCLLYCHFFVLRRPPLAFNHFSNTNRVV
jgi:hypothetical protein